MQYIAYDKQLNQMLHYIDNNSTAVTNTDHEVIIFLHIHLDKSRYLIDYNSV